MDVFPTLQTPRLTLRELQREDSAALFAIHSDQEAMKWFGSDPLTKSEQAEQLIELFAQRRAAAIASTRWGIEVRATGEFIGTCGLGKWNPPWRSCETGFELAKSAWGQGYMNEALRAIFAWGFEHMQVHRISAQVHASNERSLRLLQSVGFVREGYAREAGYWLGAFHDLCYLSLLDRDFLQGC